MSPTAETTSGKAQLMQSIDAVLADNEEQISLPLTALNQGIAQLSQDASKAVVRVGNAITRALVQTSTDQSNALDALGTAILQPLYDWQTENDLLLNHLAAAAGLIQPGDPLMQALANQTAEVPELAYSATLLIALREAMGVFPQLIEVLREIRDRMPPLSVHDAGEARASEPTNQAEGGTDVAEITGSNPIDTSRLEGF